MIEAEDAAPEEALTMLTQLEQAGVFDGIAALVIGEITSLDGGDYIDAGNESIRFEDLVQDMVSRRGVPTLKTREFGHNSPGVFAPIGGNIWVDATNLRWGIKDRYLI